MIVIASESSSEAIYQFDRLLRPDKSGLAMTITER
jgi:hypothetical protein